jgi:molecular chaperone IbpA
MEVVSADLRDGLLVIDLKREIPEALKPRQISIGKVDKALAEPRRLETQAA